MSTSIHWLGHASIRLDGPLTVYIDPWKLKTTKPADIILVTHAHRDHLSPEDIAKIASKDTTLVCPPSVVAQATPLGCRVRAIQRGGSLTIGPVTIEAVASYNMTKPNHPRSSDNVGYVVEVEGTRYYHAGDTDLIPEMDDIDCDVAFLPIGGTYTMDAVEAVQASKRLQPSTVIPIHWGDIVGTARDVDYLREHAPKGVEVSVLDVEV